MLFLHCILLVCHPFELKSQYCFIIFYYIQKMEMNKAPQALFSNLYNYVAYVLILSETKHTEI